MERPGTGSAPGWWRGSDSRPGPARMKSRPSSAPPTSSSPAVPRYMAVLKKCGHVGVREVVGRKQQRLTSRIVGAEAFQSYKLGGGKIRRAENDKQQKLASLAAPRRGKKTPEEIRMAWTAGAELVEKAMHEREASRMKRNSREEVARQKQKQEQQQEQERRQSQHVPVHQQAGSDVPFQESKRKIEAFKSSGGRVADRGTQPDAERSERSFARKIDLSYFEYVS